jgi:Flp pilus assembly protein TadG
MGALRPSAERGQALVEFSLTIVIFLVLMMAIVDLGRGIYMFNGVSQASREIARVASVHPGTTFGSSAEITAVVDTQKGLIPNLGNPVFACVDIDDSTTSLDDSTTPKVESRCPKRHRVKVTITAPYGPVTPLMGLIGTWDMTATSTVVMP